MAAKGEIEFEQKMFDFIVTRNEASAAINCMDVAKEYANYKLNKIIENIELAKGKSTLNPALRMWKVGLNRAIGIIKKEITKKD